MAGQGKHRAYEAVLLTVFILGAVAALVVAVPRHRLEQANRGVEVIADWESWRSVAAAAGVADETALHRLREAGVTRVALREVRLSQLTDAGLVAFGTYNELASWPFVNTDSPLWRRLSAFAAQHPSASFMYWHPANVAITQHDDLTARLQTAGAFQLNGDGAHLWALVPQHDETVAQFNKTWRDMGLGYDAAVLSLFVELDMPVALRPFAGPYMDATAVARRLPTGVADIVVFDGAAVPGWPATEHVWAQVLADQRTRPTLIEFTTQIGAEALVQAIDYEALRLHSIAAEELHRLPVERTVARWSRAVSERGIRALYVRPYTDVFGGVGPGDVWLRNMDYVRGLAARLQQSGWELGPAALLMLRPPSLLSYVLIAFAVAVSIIWLLRCFVTVPHWIEIVVVLLFGAGAWWQRAGVGNEAIAFLAAVVLPSLSTLRLFRSRQHDGMSRWSPVVALPVATAVSLLGALFVVGLLSETPYAMGISLFRGVKAMHVVPPFVVGAGLLWDKPVSALSDVKHLWQRWHGLHVRLTGVVLLAVAGFVGALVVLRTGNETMPVLAWELQLREWLEAVLRVRPRNKEFLLGHPAFVLGMYYAPTQRHQPVGLALLGALAAVGQASVVNTFAHLHSPLGLGLVRTGYGLLLGGLIGIVAVVLHGIIRSRGQHVPGGAKQ